MHFLNSLVHFLFSPLPGVPAGTLFSGPAAPAIAIGLSALGTGYSIYASERARAQQDKAYRQAQSQADQQRAQDQANAAQQKQQMDAQLAQQKADQQALDQKLRDEQAANLASIKGQLPGIEAQMGSSLLDQEKQAYAAMAPNIEDRLNALGLLQSGALPEAQARYQAQLESQRQAALANFDTTQQQNLSVTQPLANTEADVARQAADLQNNLATAQNNLGQTFATQNQNSANDVARSQFLASLGAGNAQANQATNAAYLQAGTGLAGSLLSAYSPNRSPATIPTAGQTASSGYPGMPNIVYPPGQNPAIAALYASRQQPNQFGGFSGAY